MHEYTLELNSCDDLRFYRFPRYVSRRLLFVLYSNDVVTV